MRRRTDGWTPARQAAFLGALAETGSVIEAARRVGMARETAYRLRRRPGAGSFVTAWDRAASQGDRPAQGDGSRKRKVTAEERAQRALFGLLKVRIYRGRHVATERKADNSALLSYLAQLDRFARAGGSDGTRLHTFAPGFVSTGCEL
ncbi:hypothetical protein WBP07_05160 [Novosphingobium sp. BL-8A]